MPEDFSLNTEGLWVNVRDCNNDTERTLFFSYDYKGGGRMERGMNKMKFSHLRIIALLWINLRETSLILYLLLFSPQSVVITGFMQE